MEIFYNKLNNACRDCFGLTWKWICVYKHLFNSFCCAKLFNFLNFGFKWTLCLILALPVLQLSVWLHVYTGFCLLFCSTVLWLPTYQLVKLRPTNLFLPVPCLINLPNLLDQSNRLTQKEFLMDAFHTVKYFCHLVWHRLFYLRNLICWPFLSVYRLVLAKLQLVYVFWSVFRNE